MAVLPWALRGLRRGTVTTGYPARPDAYADGFPGAVQPRTGAAFDPALAGVCPTGAILDAAGLLAVDQGRCILCLRCAQRRPDLVEVRSGSETAGLARDAVVVPPGPEAAGEVERVRASIRERTRAFGRSVHVRHVDLGSDGSDEWEVLALTNPYYDVQRLGIFFTASPKHADVLLLTGVGVQSMREPLQRTVEAVPRPFVTVAVGTDAVSGGPVGTTYAASPGVATLLPPGVEVDVWIPGSPATPFALLHGLLLATGRILDGTR